MTSSDNELTNGHDHKLDNNPSSVAQGREGRASLSESEGEASVQQGAVVAPDLFAISTKGELVMGYNVPLDIAYGAERQRLEWTQRRVNASVRAVIGGQADEYAREYAKDKEYSGYAIAFFCPVRDEPMRRSLIATQKALPRHDIALRWEYVETSAEDVVKQAEYAIAQVLRPISVERGKRVALWAVMLGERREAGVLIVPEGGERPIPYDGDALNRIEGVIVAHKNATYQRDGRAWVWLMASVDAEKGYYFDTQPEELPVWVQPASDEDWEKERQAFPVVE
ncbi:hypothetical protein [Corynebacterium anserum]|uniref:Uncharacterized protein n=1 Tax=Corynebacterium anserum TaxID=2684406 RepID=A0A7G7YQI0_9CORY|nr:hypothetical protein [Corynebacterium anserum]QNH96750.1 hypothetical protein GP473_08890 [Corynebacterium anserum]